MEITPEQKKWDSKEKKVPYPPRQCRDDVLFHHVSVNSPLDFNDEETGILNNSYVFKKFARMVGIPNH